MGVGAIPGCPLNNSSLSTISIRPVTKLLLPIGKTDSANQELRLRFVSVWWSLPQIRLEDQLPPGIGLKYSTDAVVRVSSPGSSASGLVRCPTDTCAAQNLLNTTVSLGKLRGRFHEYRGIPVLVTYHPAYLLPHRSPEKKRDVWDDMKVLLTRMGRPIPARSSS